jgi:ASC-1-like (ASCH) protein
MKTLVINKGGYSIQAEVKADMSTYTVMVLVEIIQPNKGVIGSCVLRRSEVVKYDKSRKSDKFANFIYDNIAGFTKEEMNQAWLEISDMVSFSEMRKSQNIENFTPLKTPIEEYIDKTEARVCRDKSIQSEESIREDDSNTTLTENSDLFDDNF